MTGANTRMDDGLVSDLAWRRPQYRMNFSILMKAPPAGTARGLSHDQNFIFGAWHVSLENFEATRRKPLRAVETRKDGVEAQYATPLQWNLPSTMF